MKAHKQQLPIFGLIFQTFNPYRNNNNKNNDSRGLDVK